MATSGLSGDFVAGPWNLAYGANTVTTPDYDSRAVFPVDSTAFCTTTTETFDSFVFKYHDYSGTCTMSWEARSSGSTTNMLRVLISGSTVYCRTGSTTHATFALSVFDTEPYMRVRVSGTDIVWETSTDAAFTSPTTRATDSNYTVSLTNEQIRWQAGSSGTAGWAIQEVNGEPDPASTPVSVSAPVAAITVTAPVPTVTAGGGTPTKTILVEPFEFDAVTDADTYTLTNDVGSLSSAFVRVLSGGTRPVGSGPTSSTSNIDPSWGCVGLALTSTDTVTAYRNGDTDTQKVLGEVWRYDGSAGGDHEFIVRGRYAITLTGTSASQAVSGIVDEDACVPVIAGWEHSGTSTSDWEGATIDAYLDGSGNIVVSRNNSVGTAVVYVQVVEFTGSAWSVGHGVSSNHDSSTETVTLNTDSTGTGGSTFDTTDWGTALILAAYMEGDSNETGLADTLASVYPHADTDKVYFSVTDGDSTARNDGAAHIHVIQNDSLAVYRETNINWAEGDGSFTSISWPTGAPTDRALEDLAWEWFTTTSGTGTAHMRGAVGPIITAATGTAQGWVHRSGNNIRLDYGIADLSGLTETAGGSVSVAAPVAAVTVSALAPTVVAKRAVSVTAPVAPVTVAALVPSVAAGQSVSVSAPVAPVTVSALVPTVLAKQTVSVSAPVAPITVAAPTPTVSAGAVVPVSVSAPVAAITVAAQTPTVLAEQAVTSNPPAAALDVAALAPTVVAGQAVSVSAPSAAVTITALVPTVEADVAVNVASPAAAITVSAPTPNVTSAESAQVSAPAAVVAVSAPVPTVEANVAVAISAPAAVVSVSAQTPTVLAERTVSVSAPAAAVTVGAPAPTVLVGGAVGVSVPPAAITVSAPVPTVLAKRVVAVSAPVAAISVTALAPTVVSADSVSVAAPAASVTVSALAPTVTAGGTVSVTPPAAVITVGAPAPTVVADSSVPVSVSAPSASVTVGAPVPTVTAGVSVDIVATPAAISVAAVTPTVDAKIAVNIATPAGVISVSAPVPTLTVGQIIPVDIAAAVAEVVVAALVPYVLAVDSTRTSQATVEVGGRSDSATLAGLGDEVGVGGRSASTDVASRGTLVSIAPREDA